MNYNGISASKGIAIAKVFKLENPNLDISKNVISDLENEINRFSNCLVDVLKDIDRDKEIASKSLGAEELQVFEAHKLIVNDPEILNAVKDMIKNDKVNAEFAANQVMENFIMIFENMDNEYFKERAADIRDVRQRIIAKLLGVKLADPSLIDEEVIVVAHDLTPSDTAKLNKQFVKGFITEIGGRTSHSAIMARSLEIPAIVGIRDFMQKVENEQLIILDGLNGDVYTKPSNEDIAKFEQTASEYAEYLEKMQTLVNAESVSVDGHHVELAANIGTPNDLEGVINNGAEGIGLYRTEFLYMGRESLPTEEEQFQSYKTVLEGLNGKPVVVRTLDIGGDKHLPYLPIAEEMNPFLGYRAIRLCLDRRDIFRTQLRGLLRASVYGPLRVMFPMIATIDEFRTAKAFLLEVKEELISEGHKVADDIQVGMMVEIPAAAVMADVFAKEVDFFSIGTNDLIQYTFAADRMNEVVSYLYQPYHPAILRLVKGVIEAAHKEGKWAGMCGEMAGDTTAIPLLLGLGLDEFSMSATSVLPARDLISKLSYAEMQKLSNEALTKANQEEVLELIKNTLEK